MAITDLGYEYVRELGREEAVGYKDAFKTKNMKKEWGKVIGM